MVLSALPAIAQQALPGTVQPGQIERRFQPHPPPRSQLAPIVPTLPAQPLAPAAAAKIHFMLRGLEITGATVYRQVDFLPIYEVDLGKEISVATLYRIADAITTKYRTAGYILSRAYVPPQRITNGIARITVVEGYVDKVVFQGGPQGRRADLFQYYRQQILASRPLQLSILERYLLLAGDLAGLNVRSVFEPSKTHEGAARLVVIFSQKPVDLQIGLDNRGTRLLGPVQLNLSGNLNNVLGLYERTGVNVVLTPQDASNLQYYHIEHEETLDGEGTTVTGGFTYIRTHPGDILAPLDVRGQDKAFTLTLAHPFIRSREKNLSAGLSFRYEDVTTEELGVRVADDRIRSLSAHGSYDFSDAWRGITQITGGMSHGLPIIGATPDDNPIPSRIDGKTDFVKFNLAASRKQELPRGFSILAQAEGQYSPDSLLASEQFAFGGLPFGRAYDPAELTGDSGLAESVELRYTPAIAATYLRTAQFFTYYDAGQVFNHIHPTLPGTLTAASAGLGVRVTPTPFLFTSLQADKPLTRIVAAEGNKGWRIFFRIVARY
jgi:hemolysin activation/secretion protein